MRTMRKPFQWLFWVAFIGFIAWDVTQSRAIDRFSEPPVIAAGSGVQTAGGHCSAVPR